MENPIKIGILLDKAADSLDRRVSVAPMMDYTDRHCRYLLRLLSPGALLYTEMVTARALLYGDSHRLLAFDVAEQPVALQLGGSEPAELAAAAKLGEAAGYREINLNCGCPSDRVQSGSFGACLMSDPVRVRDSVTAMREVVSVPVTVKCRIGIEPGMGGLGEYEFLQGFVDEVARSGCNVFVVHARIAVLKGLSPKENREIPPLRYDVVAKLRTERPDLTLILNGGIRSVAEARNHLHAFDGVMLGREAYHNPYVLATLHRAMCDSTYMPPTRAHIVTEYARYMAGQTARGERLASMTRHLLGLYSGQPGARSWRQFVSEQSRSRADADFLLESLRIVEQPEAITAP